MGWDSGNVSPLDWGNADWSAVARINQIQSAIAERTGGGALSIAGDDVQDHLLFASWQAAVEAILIEFVISHHVVAGDSTIYPADHYFGTGVLPTYTCLADLLMAAGLATDGWRRYTTHPDDGGVVHYGPMVSGDIIGWWIFEDLQDCLNCLAWKAASPTWIDGAHQQAVCSWTTEWSWANAKAYCDGIWPVDPGYTYGEPHRFSQGDAPNFDGSYYAELTAEKDKAYVDRLLAADKTIDFWVKGKAGGMGTPVFNNNGDANISNGSYNKWHTADLGSVTEYETTDYLGSTDKPAWFTPPGAGSYGEGWRVDHQEALVRYQFEYRNPGD
jgi:hypothetical protein